MNLQVAPSNPRLLDPFPELHFATLKQRNSTIAAAVVIPIVVVFFVVLLLILEILKRKRETSVAPKNPDVITVKE